MLSFVDSRVEHKRKKKGGDEMKKRKMRLAPSSPA